MPKRPDKAIGFLCAICAAIAYGTNPLFGLPLYARGMTTPSVLVYRFAGGIILLGCYKLLTRSHFRISAKDLLLLLAGGLLLGLSCLFLFLSFRVMDAGIAETILFVYPVMVALIMAAGFHERLPPIVWAGMAAALGGVAMLNGVGGRFSFAGLACVLLSALTYAIYMVLIRESRLKALASDTLTFYAMAAGLPVFLAALRGGRDLQFPNDAIGWICACGIALFPGLLAFLLTASATRRIGATTTAVIGALEPCTALAVGVAVFHERLTPRAVAGILLILVAVSVVMVGREMSKAKAGGTP